jgi:hypothetical protein
MFASFSNHETQQAELGNGLKTRLDVASHIVSDERLGEPRTNRELFDLLEHGGWIVPELAEILRKTVAFATCSSTAKTR